MLTSPASRQNRRRIAPINSNGSILFDTSNQSNTSPTLTWNTTTNILTVGNAASIGNITVTTSSVIIGNSTVNAVINSTAMVVGNSTVNSNINVYSQPYYTSIVSNFNLSNTVATAQAAFPTGQQVVTLAASTWYAIKGQYIIAEAAATSHTWATAFGNSAAITSIEYSIEFGGANTAGTFASIIPPGFLTATSNAAVVCTPAIANSTFVSVIKVDGTIITSGSVNITPQVKLSAVVANPPVMQIGSYMVFQPLGSATANHGGGVWA